MHRHIKAIALVIALSGLADHQSADTWDETIWQGPDGADKTMIVGSPDCSDPIEAPDPDEYNTEDS